MHIAVNLIGGVDWMGGVVYIRNLLQALQSLPESERQVHKITLIVYPDQLKIQNVVGPLADTIYNPSLFYKVSKRLPVSVRMKGGNCFNPRQFDFMFPVIDRSMYPFPYAGWIPDFQHVYLPEYYSVGELKNIEHKYSAISKAPIVVLSSKMALNDFIRLYPESSSKGRILNFVSRAEPEYFKFDPVLMQKKYNLPDHFFLMSNQFWVHKNFEVVIEAVKRLSRVGIITCVACTGNTRDHRFPGYFDQLLDKIRGSGISDNFRFLGMIPRNDQMNLMRRCLAVIQPSLFEGWSTVVEDAKALGKTLILSDFPVHIEQNPPRAYFFSCNSSLELAECMSKVMDDLLPGPDRSSEDAARSENFEAMQMYARNFLAIAEESVAIAKQ